MVQGLWALKYLMFSYAMMAALQAGINKSMMFRCQPVKSRMVAKDCCMELKEKDSETRLVKTGDQRQVFQQATDWQLLFLGKAWPAFMLRFLEDMRSSLWGREEESTGLPSCTAVQHPARGARYLHLPAGWLLQRQTSLQGTAMA